MTEAEHVTNIPQRPQLARLAYSTRRTVAGNSSRLLTLTATGESKCSPKRLGLPHQAAAGWTPRVVSAVRRAAARAA